jgi:menaquinone-dependent protoporphyrinogen oxidase
LIPTAFFSVSGAASSPQAGPDPNGYMDATFDELDWHPTLAKAFAGGLPYRKYNVILRFFMKRVSRAAGHTTDTSRNHEMTNWEAVRLFAEDVASLAPVRRPNALEMA